MEGLIALKTTLVSYVPEPQTLRSVIYTAQSITVIKVLSMYQGSTRCGLRKPDYWHQQEVQAARITTRWRRASMAFTKWREYTVRAGKTGQKWNWSHSRRWTGITIDAYWKGWATSLRQRQKKRIMLPSEMMSWQPEFTDKTLSRNPGAVHSLLPSVFQKASFRSLKVI